VDELLAAILLGWGDTATAAGLTGKHYSRIFAQVNRFAVEGFVNCNMSGHWPDHVFRDQTLVREKVRMSRVNIMTQRENSTLGK